MKVLIHSNAPWMPTGYGKQAALAGRMLVELGHQVSFSAFAGLSGQPITWQVPGIEGREGQCAVYPAGKLQFSPDVIVPNARVAQADLIVSLMDTYKLLPAAGDLRACGIPFAPLVVTDCTAANGGPAISDQHLIRQSGALPVAVSAFGHDRLWELGPEDWEVPYVPHAIDTGIYQPPAYRKAIRDELGTGDQFIIGMCSANRDGVRKGYPETFAAFDRFSRRHDDARLAVFAVIDSPGGLPLAELASDMGIIEKVMFMPGYEQVAGLLSEEFMSHWYASIDVLSMCSYAEGFGVPAIEAMACGTPVVATDCSALTELVKGHGWLVRGHPFWNSVHRAWWVRPDVDFIVKAWEKAYQENSSQRITRSARCVDFARGNSLEKVSNHWEGFIRDVHDWTDSHAK